MNLMNQNQWVPSPKGRGDNSDHFFSGSSFLPLFSGMKGLHGWAFTGPGVFQTTSNWPSPVI